MSTEPNTQRPDGSPFPFECDNCGYKPTPQEVINYQGDCVKCGDTVIAYTIDAAECLMRFMQPPPETGAVDAVAIAKLNASQS